MIDNEKNSYKTIELQREKNKKKINVKKLVLNILLISVSLMAVVGIVLLIAFAKGNL